MTAEGEKVLSMDITKYDELFVTGEADEVISNIESSTTINKKDQIVSSGIKENIKSALPQIAWQ